MTTDPFHDWDPAALVELATTGGPRDIQDAIAESPRATRRVLRYLDTMGVEHTGIISGSTLAAVCGKTDRQWRRWELGSTPFPDACRRLLVLVAFGGFQ
jgi:hypothetical protein